VHANRKSPPSASRYVAAVVPDDVSRERFEPQSAPGWDNLDDVSIARVFGGDWIASQRSALLIVRSVVTGLDEIVVVNPDHPEAARIIAGPETPVTLDSRLFGNAGE